jgi:hypothetical protein
MRHQTAKRALVPQQEKSESVALRVSRRHDEINFGDEFRR